MGKKSKVASVATQPAHEAPQLGVKSGRVVKPLPESKAKSKTRTQAPAAGIKSIKSIKSSKPSKSKTNGKGESDSSDNEVNGHSSKAPKNSSRIKSKAASSDSEDSDSDSSGRLGHFNNKTTMLNDDSGEDESGSSASEVNGHTVKAAMDSSRIPEAGSSDSDDSESSGDNDHSKGNMKNSAPDNKNGSDDSHEDSEDDSSEEGDNPDADSGESSDDDSVQSATTPHADQKEETDASKKRKLVGQDPRDAKRPKANEPSTNLHIGNLSWNMDSDGLSEVFKKFDGFQEARVITNRDNGKSRGFGYVHFDSIDTASVALEEMQGTELDGRTIQLDFSTGAKVSSPEDVRVRNADRATDRGDQMGEPSDTLWVGNLPWKIEQQQVHDYFSEVGEVVSVRLPTDPETGSIKGFGYVTFTSMEDATKALEQLNGSSISHDHFKRPIRLDYASRSNDRSGERGRGNRDSGRGRGRGGYDGDRGGGRGFGRDGGDRGRGSYGGDRGGRDFDSSRGRGRGRGSDFRGGRGRGGDFGDRGGRGFSRGDYGGRGGGRGGGDRDGGRGRGGMRLNTNGAVDLPAGERKILFSE